MSHGKKYISYALYSLSILLLVGEGLYTGLLFKDFISAGEGIGVYGVLVYYVAAFCSVVLWGVSYWIAPSNKLALVFWVIFIVFTLFIAFQPTWWAAPSIDH